MAALLLALPTESLDAVCALVDAADLVALALTCRLLALVAQRRLYRHILLAKDAKSAVVTLARNPHIARHVRSFELAPLGDAVFPAFVRLLARAVANMRAAVAVSFAVGHHAPIFACELHTCFERVPDDCEYAQLRSLACDLPFDTYTVRFLARCPALVSLQLGAANAPAPPLSLPSSITPRLDTLVGAADAARTLVPGRPVSCVQLLSPDALDTTTVSALALSAVPVACLDAVMADFSLPQLALVAQQLGAHLGNLRVVVLNAFASAPDAVRTMPCVHASVG